jgi:RimJ/RimL family protein N-acetyltransferase
MKIEPLTLLGDVVRLEPLAESHAAQLAIAGHDDNIWRYMLYGFIRNEDQMLVLIRDLLNRQREGMELPFTVIHLDSQHAIGMTRYLDIHPDHRGLEIGGTWYAPAFQRTAVNTECKYLLLKHAFETLSCIRVQFKTDARNIRSQTALERIGAVKEGTLRNHMITPFGDFRDSVYYSILDNEWPKIKTRLESLLDRK